MADFKVTSGIDIKNSSHTGSVGYNIINSYIPVGAIISFAGPRSIYDNYPTTSGGEQCLLEGIVPCDGRTLDSASYPGYSNLFDSIGTIYGGSGSSSFQVPNLKQQVHISGNSGALPGVNASANTHTHAIAAGQSIFASTNNSNSESFTHSHGNISHTLSTTNATSHVHYYENQVTVNSGTPSNAAANKNDGNLISAGRIHTHSTPWGESSNFAMASTPNHTHTTNSSLNNTALTPNAHTHVSTVVPQTNIGTTTLSSALEVPYLCMLYFIKI
jgi:microcystin-dependent protein